MITVTEFSADAPLRSRHYRGNGGTRAVARGAGADILAPPVEAGCPTEKRSVIMGVPSRINQPQQHGEPAIGAGDVEGFCIQKFNIMETQSAAGLKSPAGRKLESKKRIALLKICRGLLDEGTGARDIAGVSRALANGVVERATGTHGSSLQAQLRSAPLQDEAGLSRLGDSAIAEKCCTLPAALVSHTAETPGRRQSSRRTKRRSE